jgi:hypothetical protein
MGRLVDGSIDCPAAQETLCVMSNRTRRIHSPPRKHVMNQTRERGGMHPLTRSSTAI